MIALRKTRLGAELMHKCVEIAVQSEKRVRVWHLQVQRHPLDFGVR